MNDNDELLTAQQESGEVLDLDDVEGHGLREVAAGLGAAAVLAGGASAVAATGAISTPSLPSVHPSASVQVDPVGTVDRATDSALATARAARDGALNEAGRTAANAVAKADQTQQHARSTVDGAAATAVRTVQADAAAATTIAGDAARWTAGEATSSVSGAKTTATGTASGAEQLAGTVVRDSGRRVSTVLSVVSTTAANGITTVTASLRSIDAGAGADAMDATGWMTLKVGDMSLQAQVHDGSATFTVGTPLASALSGLVSYTGDAVFAPADRSFDLAL